MGIAQALLSSPKLLTRFVPGIGPDRLYRGAEDLPFAAAWAGTPSTERTDSAIPVKRTKNDNTVQKSPPLPFHMRDRDRKSVV